MSGGPRIENNEIDTLVLVNNSISADLAAATLKRDGVDLRTVALIALRQLHRPWFDQCAWFLDYGGKPSAGFWGQARFAAFYRKAASLLRTLRRAGRLRRAYIVNSDNLLTNAVLRWAERRPTLQLTVLAEGIMNFQDIQIRNRDWWRQAIKPGLATALGLGWRRPRGHLSGAFESAVSRVVSFSAEGLMAPREKVVVLAFPKVAPRTMPDPQAVLIAHTGLWQWMKEEDYRDFAKTFVRWLESLRYSRLLVKPHPRVAFGLLEDYLPPHEIVEGNDTLEDMASIFPAATVLGTCCTGLITLKLMRPDLRCIDFGSDVYCEKAYFGDRGVERILQAAGVELVPAGIRK